jgi:hypothetical protein
MQASGRNPRAVLAERYAAKAARAAQQGDRRRASELYLAAFRALHGEEECDTDPLGLAFNPAVEERPSGVRARDATECTEESTTRPGDTREPSGHTG